MEGNKKSIYFTGEGPTGYCKPEDIDWLRPEKMNVKERP
jgi:hypothetical protein